MKMNRVLVIAAHPDDEILGCGATIHKILNLGAKVRVLILGEGSTCRWPSNLIDSDDAKKAITQRRMFAENAMAYLGVSEVIFEGLPCGRFDQVPIIDIGKLMEAQIADFKPDTVFTHHGSDANSDHRITFDATIAATRPTPNHCVKNVLSFEVVSSSEWRFIENLKPNLFIDIDQNIDAKVAAFNFYSLTEGREFPFPRSVEGLRIQAKLRGMQVGLLHAEAFQIVRTTVL